jgi:hypothetical protein
MGKQTACVQDGVLMLTDKLAGDPRKLTLSFLLLEASVIQGPNLCLDDGKNWHPQVTDLQPFANG